MRTPEQWTPGDYAIARRESPVDFFRVVGLEHVPGELEPLLIPAWCCSQCDELEDLLGRRRVIAMFFRRATKREIRKLAGRSFCVYRNSSRVDARVGACTRRLELELGARLSAPARSGRR